MLYRKIFSNFLEFCFRQNKISLVLNGTLLESHFFTNYPNAPKTHSPKLRFSLLFFNNPSTIANKLVKKFSRFLHQTS